MTYIVYVVPRAGNKVTIIRARMFKTTMSLVNVSLKFQSNLNISNTPIFLFKRCALQKLLLFFSTKNVSVFGYKVVKHLTI